MARYLYESIYGRYGRCAGIGLLLGNLVVSTGGRRPSSLICLWLPWQQFLNALQDSAIGANDWSYVNRFHG